MLDDRLMELVDATSTILGLAASVIEKDYYITRIIHRLSVVENDYFRLVFAGGTCLAKAHKIVKRMSEDVDFKIQVKNPDTNLSKTQFLKELKQFRSQIMSMIVLPDFIVGETAVRNEGKYLRVELNYPSSFPGNEILRPHLLLEFSLSDVRLPLENLSIKTLIEDTLKTITIFETCSTHCISVDETAIEKWVGLTRRIAAIEREYHYDDPALVRHIYDLTAIKHANKINSNFFTLASAIISYDIKQFKSQHPEYAENPTAEIQQSLAILKNKSLWKTRYQEFMEAMVYDNISARDYESALQVLENISKSVIDSINHPKASH